jgi:hypothetical protein
MVTFSVVVVPLPMLTDWGWAVMVGGVMTVMVAMSESTLPALFEAWTRNRVVPVMEAIEKLSEFAPGMALKLPVGVAENH